MHFVADFGSVRVGKKLVQYKADLNATDADGKTPLINAAFKNRTEVAGFLLRNGADVNFRQWTYNKPYNFTALHYAAWKDGHKIAKLILDKEGVQIDTQDDIGETPLHWTARASRSASIAKLLINKGANVNAIDNEGKTTLHHLAKHPHGHSGPYPPRPKINVDFAKFLLKKGANKTALDNKGMTPLDLAVNCCTLHPNHCNQPLIDLLNGTDF